MAPDGAVAKPALLISRMTTRKCHVEIKGCAFAPVYDDAVSLPRTGLRMGHIPLELERCVEAVDARVIATPVQIIYLPSKPRVDTARIPIDFYGQNDRRTPCGTSGRRHILLSRELRAPFRQAASRLVPGESVDSDPAQFG